MAHVYQEGDDGGRRGRPTGGEAVLNDRLSGGLAPRDGRGGGRRRVSVRTNRFEAPTRADALVAEREETAVGVAHATWSTEGATGDVLRRYVDPDTRREGLGSELLERTCTEPTDCGAERISAMVLLANEPGAGFSERFGFAFVDERTTIGEESYPESRYVPKPDG